MPMHNGLARRRFLSLGLFGVATMPLLGCSLARFAWERVVPTPAPAQRQPRRRGELRLPGATPPTFDPALSQDSTSATYIVEIYSGLMTATPALELVPDLAEGYTLGGDGRVYTFKLREGISFHSGRPVTAEDIKFSLERACHPATGSPVAATYLGDIVGAREMLSGAAPSLSGVRVVDPHTVEIEIDAPRASFLAKLTHPVSFVVDRERIGLSDPVKAANGTGPFRLASVRARQEIVLEASTSYYREPRPALERVRFLLGAGHAVTMYENDELDAAPVGVGDLPRLTDPANELSQELTVSEQLATFYVGFHCQVPPFEDVHVRRAFAMSLDRQKIVDVLYKKTVPAAHTVVPPLMPDYDNTGLAAPPFDPGAARRELALSAYGRAESLPPVTLYVSSSSPYTDEIARAIATLWEEHLGVRIGIEQREWGYFLQGLADPWRPYQSYILGWIADYPDPENFLQVLFHSKSNDNHSHYSNPQVDSLLEQAALELDKARRHALYLEAERLVLEEAPIVPLYHDVEYWLTKPYVRDMHYPPLIVPRLQYVRLAQA
jgi:ABC-type transport system substrate-binding protein